MKLTAPNADDFTHIDVANVYQCNYCGGYAKTIDEIKHHATCTRAKGMKQYDGLYEEE